MSKKLYHIETSLQYSLMIQSIGEKENIEIYVSTGGVHLYLTSNQVSRGEELASIVNSKLEENGLPAVLKMVNEGLAKMMEKV
jgi:hypothetical protein